MTYCVLLGENTFLGLFKPTKATLLALTAHLTAHPLIVTSSVIFLFYISAAHLHLKPTFGYFQKNHKKVSCKGDIN